MPLNFSASVNNLNYRMPALKIDHMNQNQGRTVGPVLGLFLVNLLAKLVSAKYYSYFPFQLTYDPNPWLAYNKPAPSYNHHTYYSQWYPIKNPYSYEGPYQTYPTLTTTAPYINHDYNDYSGNYDYYDRIPAESNNIKNQVVQELPSTEKPKEVTSTSTSKTTTSAVPPTVTTVTEVTSTLAPETTTVTEDTVAAASNFKPRRQPTQKRRRGPTRRDKYPQKRRRTTTPAYYYDSYEESTESYQPNRRRRPYRPQSAESYYEEDNEYEYDYETTTKYFKKQKRRPTRKVIKNQNRNDDSVEIINVPATTERINPNTEIVIVRQATPSTTTTTTASSTTGTTEPSTIITNSTVSTTTSGYNQTYGYGPSNGNEHVSFTYGPPIGNQYQQYQAPYFDWYAHEATRNAIVKRVRDIVNTDKRLK